jgi:hypothetical protein
MREMLYDHSDEAVAHLLGLHYGDPRDLDPLGLAPNNSALFFDEFGKSGGQCFKA